MGEKQSGEAAGNPGGDGEDFDLEDARLALREYLMTKNAAGSVSDPDELFIRDGVAQVPEVLDRVGMRAISLALDAASTRDSQSVNSEQAVTRRRSR